MAGESAFNCASHARGAGRETANTMRVAIGGISHETNTFSVIGTDLALFQRRSLLRGQTLIDASRGVGNALGGMVDAASALGWELVPTLFASATPSGRVRHAPFEALTNELVAGIAGAGRLDGVLLALHGAMVVEGLDDAEGEILQRVRRAVGAGTPVVVVLDFHANLTPAIADLADVVIGYETYPHIDPYARGTEAVSIIQRVRQHEIRPVHALRQLPMLTPLTAQWTLGPTPMRDLMRLALEAEHEPGIVCVMLAGGFPYSDIPDAGMAVLVTADRNQALADAVADRLAAECWERREFFRVELTPLAEAVERVLAAPSTPTGPIAPIVLADVADNPGAGASCDGTLILDALLRAGASGVAVGVIADPESVAQAEAIGVGKRGPFILGGKIDHLHGPSLEIEALVRSVGNAAFTNSGPMGIGARTRLGKTAVLEIDPGIEVIVTENRIQTLDPELFRAVGIAPEERRALVVKSSVHFRAGFEPLASEIIEVDAPGLASPDLAALPYRRVRRPIWPLDEDASWP